MVTKTSKKKPSKLSGKASASTAAPAAKSESSAAKSASVIPFNPLSTITNSTLCNFNPSVPSFGGSFDSMESVMTNYKDQYEKISGDATASVRQGVETLVKSSSTFAKGTEQIVKTLVEVAQESSQRNSQAIKSLLSSRTLNEFAEAQNKLAQQNFDEAMSTATKLSEMTIKLYTEAFEPINSQVTKAAKKATESFAA